MYSKFCYCQEKLFQNVGNCISGYSWDTMGKNPAIHPSYLLIWLLMQMLQGNANMKEACTLYVFSVLHYCTTAEEGVLIESYITSQIIFSTSVPVWSVHHISFCCSICWSLCGVNENRGMNNDSPLWLHQSTCGDAASCSFPVMIWNFCFLRVLWPVRNTNAPLWMYSRGNYPGMLMWEMTKWKVTCCFNMTRSCIY